MNVLGIIAEYNPFHNGHALQLNECKKMADADYTVIAMSGNFTQRGEAAITDKFVRTQMALNCGADLVLELPVQAACSSAGYFADGGVSMLKHTGIVTHLGFGSESGEIALLKKAAALFSDESEIFKTRLSACLKSGLTYAQARQHVLESIYPETRQFLTPNNTLAVEYIRAIHKQKASIKPITLKRRETGYHDLSMDSAICSATALRHVTHTSASGCGADKKAADFSDNFAVDFSRHMPHAAAAIYNNYLKTHAPVKNADFSDMLYYALCSSNNFSNIADIDRQLSDRICRLRFDFKDFDTFCALLKSRNYTMTRIMRAMYHLIFSMTDEDFSAFLSTDSAPYIRILGFRKAAAPLLSALKNHCDIPVITKAADASKLLPANLLRIYDKNLFADNLYRHIQGRLCGQKIPHEFSRGIMIV